MKLSISKSALILIEFQKQWTDPGLYHTLIKGQLASRKVIENTRRLTDEARGRGIRIIHAPLVIDPKNKRGWFAHLTLGKVFTLGSRKAEITPTLYQEGDPVVKGRYSFDSFIGSDLEQLLRSHGLSTLFVCGFTTDQCVAKTLRTALLKGFDAYLMSDCTATMNHFFQKKTERGFGERSIESRKLMSMWGSASAELNG
jgi:nicotinamidase-related amidase